MMRLGPLGALRDIPSYPEVSVSVERPGNTLTSLGGKRYAQRAPQGKRSWSLSMRYMTPADLAYLTALATGAIPGPLYLYTDAAAQTNLLPADIAAPGLMGASGLSLPNGSRPPRGRIAAYIGTTTLDAANVTLGVSCDPSVDGQWSAPIPVRPTAAGYRISCWSTAAAESLLVSALDRFGGRTTAGSVTTASAGMSIDGLAGFRGETALTMGGGSTVAFSFALPSNADPAFRVGALRLTEGTAAQDGAWLPGHGVPEVVIDDPEQTLQLVTATRVASNYSITLREVG